MLPSARLVLLLCVLVSSSASAQDRAPFLGPSQQFSSSGAMEIVEFLSQRWRTRGGGNPGFDASIDYVRNYLQVNGFTDSGDLEIIEGPLTLYPLAWHPKRAEIRLANDANTRISSYPANPTLMARFSGSTPKGGIEGQVVLMDGGDKPEHYKAVDVRGKIVLGRAHIGRFYQQAVVERGALGVISDDLARERFYLDHPEMVRYGSLNFTDAEAMKKRKSWGLKISPQAGKQIRDAVKAGTDRLRIKVQTEFYKSTQRALVAEIPGTVKDAGRIFFVCHMDNNRPGANNNATGVAAHAELARILAAGIKSGDIPRPKRSLVFLFGAEHSGTDMWLNQAAGTGKTVAAFNADMTGAKTESTGGIYRFERYPDPSTDSPRKKGERNLSDQRSGWGFRSLGDVPPPGHYFNALMWNVIQEQSKRTGWRVFQNPFEGGSDHDELLSRGIPTVLSWYYDDPFLSTNLDTPDKVDPISIRNVASVHGTAALLMASAGENEALSVLKLIEESAKVRLQQEAQTAKKRLQAVAMWSTQEERKTWFRTWEEEQRLARRWHSWEKQAIESVSLLLVGEPTKTIVVAIRDAQTRLAKEVRSHLQALDVIALSMAPGIGADEILRQSIAYHDPKGSWGRSAFRFTIEEGRPDGSSKTTEFLTQASVGRFFCKLMRGKKRIEIDINAEKIVASVDGRSDLTVDERKKLRLTPKRLQVTRNYYEYLYGLPMKLRDPGTIIHPRSWRQEFNGRQVDAIRATYDKDVGHDVWHFFFDPATHAMIGYLFYHDEKKGDGEYITLTGESRAPSGLRLPQIRKWYTNIGDRFLGTDTTKKLDDAN